MKMNWLCVLLALCAASSAHAQTWSAYGYPSAYYYYRPQPAPAYYYPPTYYAAPPVYYSNPGASASASDGPTLVQPAPKSPEVKTPTYYAAPPYSNPGASAIASDDPTLVHPAPTTPDVKTPTIKRVVKTAPAPLRQPSIDPTPPVIQTPEVKVTPVPEVKVTPVPVKGSTIEPAPLVTQQPDPKPAPTPPEPDRFTVMWNNVVEWAQNPGDPRTRSESVWVTGSYVAAFIKPMHVSGPLVTTGDILDTPPGGLASPNTRVLFGDNRINDNLASGFTLGAGAYLDCDHRVSVEGAIFFVTTNTTTTRFSADGDGNPLLTRPFFATDLGRQAVAFNSLPGALDGKLNLTFRSNLGGAELNGRIDASSGTRLRSDILLGVRYVRLEDRMQIEESVNALGGTTIPFNGQLYNGIVNSDSFNSINQFIGGQIGGRIAYDHPWFDLSLFGKLGLGGTVQQVNINGSTAFLSPTGAVSTAGGVLALPSNIGTYQRTVFGVLPELGVNFGLRVSDHVRVEMGYSALLWNRVARGGSNVDTSLNTGLIPSSQNFGVVTGPVAPVFRFNDEFFWTHSLRVGLEVSY